MKTLSDERYGHLMMNEFVYSEKDVKEFIKELKNETKRDLESHTEGYKFGMRHMRIVIDKLAGPKLLK